MRSDGAAPHARETDPEVRANLWSPIPNRITTLRLAALPLLWVMAALGETAWLAAGLAVAALTDVADGVIARLSGTTTTFGSRLDSIADHLLTGSTIVWLLWLRPDFFARERATLTAWLILGIVSLLVGWVKFRRIGGLHLYSAKVAGVAGYLLAIWLLFSASYPRWIFFTVIGLASLAALETMAVFLTRREVDETIGSIFLPRPPDEGRSTPGRI